MKVKAAIALEKAQPLVIDQIDLEGPKLDGSVFVTAGAVNPTSTIQAFALYVANHIKNL